jgi:hypothetical protein
MTNMDVLIIKMKNNVGNQFLMDNLVDKKLQELNLLMKFM